MKGNRTESNKNRKEEILEKAAQLFYENGYELTTMRKIAKFVGIEASTIYYYFESKEEIVKSLQSLIWDRFSELIEKADSIKTTESRIKDYFRKAIQHQIGSKDLAFLFDEIVPSKYAKHLASRRKELYRHLRKELVDFLREKGLQDSINPTIAAFLIFSAIGQIHRWYDPNGIIKPQELTDQIIQIFFHGISGTNLTVNKNNLNIG